MLIAKPTDTLTRDVIAAAIAVHREFGPGLFERAYVAPFVWELQDRGFNCVCEADPNFLPRQNYRTRISD